MTIGGERVDALAERFGTPLLAIDLDVLDGALDAMLAAASPHDIAISYAGKGPLATGACSPFASRPIGIDVVFDRRTRGRANTAASKRRA